MKGKGLAVGFGIFALAMYAYYVLSGAVETSNFIDWIESIVTRGNLKVNSLTGTYLDKALSLIADIETFSAKAYPDPPGQYDKYSIGYGHQLRSGDGFSATSTITEATALQLLADDVSWADTCVGNSVTSPLTDNQRAALMSLAYNIGCGAFQDSTLVSKLNTGDYAGASAEFPRWNRANGSVLQALIDRRTKEQELFNS